MILDLVKCRLWSFACVSVYQSADAEIGIRNLRMLTVEVSLAKKRRRQTMREGLEQKNTRTHPEETLPAQADPYLARCEHPPHNFGLLPFVESKGSLPRAVVVSVCIRVR